MIRGESGKSFANACNDVVHSGFPTAIEGICSYSEVYAIEIPQWNEGLGRDKNLASEFAYAVQQHDRLCCNKASHQC